MPGSVSSNTDAVAIIAQQFRVEYRNFALFWIFKMSTLLSIRYIFRSFSLNNWRFLPRTRGEVFTFKKSQGPYIFFTLANTFILLHFKEQLSKRKFGINFCSIPVAIFLAPKMGQIDFAHGEDNNFF